MKDVKTIVYAETVERTVSMKKVLSQSIGYETRIGAVIRAASLNELRSVRGVDTCDGWSKH